jgi:hypothetical protein
MLEQAKRRKTSSHCLQNTVRYITLFALDEATWFPKRQVSHHIVRVLRHSLEQWYGLAVLVPQACKQLPSELFDFGSIVRKSCMGLAQRRRTGGGSASLALNALSQILRRSR